MERKGDTMFELLTNVVKEMQCLKGVNQYYESFFQSRSDSCPVRSEPVQTAPSCSYEKRIIDLSVEDEQPASVLNVVKRNDTKIVVSESESDSASESSDSESESDSEYESDLESDASDSESISGTTLENADLTVDIGDIRHVAPLRSPSEDIVVGNFEVDPLSPRVEKNVDLEIIDDILSDVVENVRLSNVDGPHFPTSLPSVDSLRSPENFESLVEKTEVSPSLENIDIPPPDFPTSAPSIRSTENFDFTKMNITQLKTLATSAGIQQDLSKMKKKDIIRLLEKLDEYY